MIALAGPGGGRWRLAPEAWLAGFCILAHGAAAGLDPVGRHAATGALLEANAEALSLLRQGGRFDLYASARVQADMARCGEAPHAIDAAYWAETFHAREAA